MSSSSEQKVYHSSLVELLWRKCSWKHSLRKVKVNKFYMTFFSISNIFRVVIRSNPTNQNIILQNKRFSIQKNIIWFHHWHLHGQSDFLVGKVSNLIFFGLNDSVSGRERRFQSLEFFFGQVYCVCIKVSLSMHVAWDINVLRW